jgi:hypothetical protein
LAEGNPHFGLLRAAIHQAICQFAIELCKESFSGVHKSLEIRGFMEKTVLSFYVDDTNPYDAPPEAFKIFLDFVSGEGAAGEASLILGYNWKEHGHIRHPLTDFQAAYLSQVQRAYVCGIDTHCELYTHDGLFDFQTDCMPAGALHEGVWLFEPAVSLEEYEAYFSHILRQGEALGLRYTGLTWPGCDCPACSRRYQQLREAGVNDPNPNFWQALLSLAKAGRFRGRSVPCFFGEDLPEAQAHLMAADGMYGVYTLSPNAGDHFGVWLNDPQFVHADYYITADGQSGRIVELVRSRAPYALFFTHWQGLNPVNGVGWTAFTQVIQRIQKHLRDQVVWMRPSEYTDCLLR